MSTIHETNDSHDDVRRNDGFLSMNPREQFRGMLVLIVFLLLAILLRSL